MKPTITRAALQLQRCKALIREIGDGLDMNLVNHYIVTFVQNHDRVFGKSRPLHAISRICQISARSWSRRKRNVEECALRIRSPAQFRER